MINAGEIKKIKNKYSDCDRIVCALGSEIGDLTKFKFIEQCDFYILIGRSFHLTNTLIKSFQILFGRRKKNASDFF